MKKREGKVEVLEKKIAVEYCCENITFVLTDTKTAFEIGTQFFVLQMREPYYWKRLATIRLMITLGEIPDIHKLAELTKGRVEWVHSKRDWL